jgi:hypothetical protein
MAPEIESGERPHSRVSDAFSVGKTLEAFYYAAAAATSGTAVADADGVADNNNSAIMDAVIQPLMNASLDNRMGLPDANEWLESHVSARVGQLVRIAEDEKKTAR